MSCIEFAAENEGQYGDAGGGEDPLAGLDPRRFGRCPSCRLIVERIEACSHMICRCGTHFYVVYMRAIFRLSHARARVNLCICLQVLYMNVYKLYVYVYVHVLQQG
jgi:hypothetical protein